MVQWKSGQSSHWQRRYSWCTENVYEDGSWRSGVRSWEIGYVQPWGRSPSAVPIVPVFLFDNTLGKHYGFIYCIRIDADTR